MLLVITAPFFIIFFIILFLGSIENEDLQKKTAALILANGYWIFLVLIFSNFFDVGEFGIFFEWIVCGAAKISLLFQGIKICLYFLAHKKKIIEDKKTFRINLCLDILLIVIMIGTIILIKK